MGFQTIVLILIHRYNSRENKHMDKQRLSYRPPGGNNHLERDLIIATNKFYKFVALGYRPAGLLVECGLLGSVRVFPSLECSGPPPPGLYPGAVDLIN